MPAKLKCGDDGPSCGNRCGDDDGPSVRNDISSKNRYPMSSYFTVP